MSDIKDGGPAFPNVPDGAGDKWQNRNAGMTLRDYFAAKAMNGVLSDPNVRLRTSEEVAELAAAVYRIADAMLRARES